MQIGDVTIRTRGQVGFDQPLRLVAEIPVQDRWVAQQPYLAGLRGQTLKVPIRGTFQRPSLDARVLQSLTAAIVARGGRGLSAAGIAATTAGPVAEEIAADVRHRRHDAWRHVVEAGRVRRRRTTAGGTWGRHGHVLRRWVSISIPVRPPPENDPTGNGHRGGVVTMRAARARQDDVANIQSIRGPSRRPSESVERPFLGLAQSCALADRRRSAARSSSAGSAHQFQVRVRRIHHS